MLMPRKVRWKAKPPVILVWDPLDPSSSVEDFPVQLDCLVRVISPDERLGDGIERETAMAA